jgi:hypothetical protein
MGNGAQRLTRTSTATKAPSSVTSETDTHHCAALSGPPLAISLQYPDPIVRPCTTKPYPTERGHTTADRDSEHTAAPGPAPATAHDVDHAIARRARTIQPDPQPATPGRPTTLPGGRGCAVAHPEGSQSARAAKRAALEPETPGPLEGQ